MGLVIFDRYNNIGEALVVFSALEAAGFYPSWENYHHAHIAYLQIIAFGGLIINLPKNEHEAAHTFLRQCKSLPKLEGDDLPNRKFGMWRNVLAMLSFKSPLFLFAPLLWAKPIFLTSILAAFFLILILGLFLGPPIMAILFFAYLFQLLGVAMMMALGIWPVRTTLGIILVWLVAALIVGFEYEYAYVLLSLLPIGILIHAKHIALPRLQRRRAHVA